MKPRKGYQERHGCAATLDRTPEYIVWLSMVSRCTNPRHSSYRHYGARGIRICDRWLDSFTLFLADMGERPSLSHTIDRIDNDGNYEPTNCRWATKKEQARNRRGNVSFTAQGVVATVAEWAERMGVTCSMLYARKKRGWLEREIVSVPARRVLSKETVLAMCQEYDTEKTPRKELAAKYQITLSSVTAVLTGRQWGDVTGRKWTPSGRSTPIKADKLERLLPKIRAMLQEGIPERGIALKLGILRGPVSRVSRELKRSR